MPITTPTSPHIRCSIPLFLPIGTATGFQIMLGPVDFHIAVVTDVARVCNLDASEKAGTLKKADDEKHLLCSMIRVVE
jgi:hypothetical protein